MCLCKNFCTIYVRLTTTSLQGTIENSIRSASVIADHEQGGEWIFWNGLEKKCCSETILESFHRSNQFHFVVL